MEKQIDRTDSDSELHFTSVPTSLAPVCVRTSVPVRTLKGSDSAQAFQPL